MRTSRLRSSDRGRRHSVSSRPPSAADKDAFNSNGLRKAVTLGGVREHQAALQRSRT